MCVKTGDIRLSNRFVVICLFVTSLILNNAFLSNMFFRDSFTYAWAAESESVRDLFHSHHLLYVPLCRLYYNLWRGLGYDGGALVPLQTLTTIMGALGVSLLFLVLSIKLRDRASAAFAAIFMGVSYAFWAYSMQAYPYVFAVSLLIASYLSLVKGMMTSRSLWLVVAGLLNAAAILFHQMTGLFLPVAIVAILIDRAPFSIRLRRLALFLLPVGICVTMAYVGVGFAILKFSSLNQLFYFATERAQTLGSGTSVGYGSLSPVQLLKVPIGIGNMFVGEIFVVEYLLANTDLFSRILLLTGAGGPQDYLAADWGLLTYVLSLLLGYVVAILVTLLAYALRNAKRLWGTYYELVVPCLVWVGSFGVFLTWYVPELRQWWLFVLPPLCILFGLILVDMKQKLVRRISPQVQQAFSVVFVTALFSVNFFGSILPLHDPAHNADLRMTRLLASYAHQGDWVIVLDRGELKNLMPYLAYFNHNKVMGMLYLFTSRNADEIRHQYHAQLEDSLQTGHQVYVVADVFQSEVGYAQIARHTPFSEEQVTEEIAEFFARYDLSVVLEQNGVPLLYQVSQRY